VSHPSLDTFGDLDEAARDPHVSDCERCSGELRAQQQVRDLLSSLPDPGPAPPDVVDRLEATLRRLSAETAPPGADPAGGTAASTVVPMRPASTGHRRRPLLAVAAAAVLLAGGGFGLSRLVPHTGGADSTAAGAAMSDSGRKEAVPSQDLHSTASGTSYSRARLAAQVQQVLSAAPTAGLSAPQGPLATASGIAECLAAIGAPRVTPLLVDVARFEGHPAAVIVLPTDGGGREIWVVAPTCRPGADGTTFFTRVR
jgi:hypothetical protein